MDSVIKNYLSKIGQKGGRKSRRQLTSEDARTMIKIREARRAFKKFYATCFWSFNKSLLIQKKDIPWVVEQLRKHGGRQAWETAEYLCR